MAYINPGSEIILYNVPLTRNMEHTVYFDSREAQRAAFNGHKIKAFKPNYYVRPLSGSLKVPIIADEIVDCNYVSFINSPFNGRLYYAFIDSIEYDNNNCSIVNFTIDYFQTYITEFELETCLVEREHTDSDRIGDHTVLEGFECKDVVRRRISAQYMPFNGEYDVLVMLPNETRDIGAVSNQIQGAEFVKYTGTPGEIFNKLTEWIHTNPNQAEQVITAYAYPKVFNPTGTTGWGATRDKADVYKERLIKETSLSKPTNLASYTPRNNKLFTAQFNKLIITDHNGHTADFRFERFYDDKCKFEIGFSFSATPEIYISPTNYEHSYNNSYYKTLRSNDIPFVGLANNAFRQYWAQNGGKNLISVVGSVGGAVITENPVAYVAAVASVANAVSGSWVASSTGSTDITTSSGGSNVMNGKQGFTAYQECIKAEQAKIIDDFFTKYGYCVNSVKKPSMRNRTHYTYVKTKGCVVSGRISTKAQLSIAEMFDKGVTIWSNMFYVFDYNQSNTPLNPLAE